MKRRLSVQNRYLLAIGGLVALAMLLVGGAYWVTESQRLGLQADAKAARDLVTLNTAFGDAVRDQESAVADYLLSSRPMALDRFREAVAAEDRLGQAMTRATVDAPDLRGAIDAVMTASAAWRAAFADPAITANRAGAAIESFTSGAAADHETVQGLVEDLTAARARRDATISAQTESLAEGRATFTAFGLAVTLAAAGLALLLIRRYGMALEKDANQAGIFNRFTEVSSFAPDDAAIAASNLEALALLVHPDAAVTHMLNRSKDRGVPEAILGSAAGEVLQLSALSRCAGLVRGSMYVTSDASAPLSVHCPVYPVTSGTVACVPLTSGETVGTVHLYWRRPGALPLESRAGVTRIAEHAALTIANRRLLAVLQGQASTDPRTGLANSRAFDLALESALAERASDERIAVLMLDLDRFKDFNDRHGHPAGDEALRVFATILRSCMRDGDLAARYGGEEFAVLLAGLDEEATLAVAERIRSRTEATLISLAPGLTGRITVSIGIAAAPAQGVERVALLRLADEALYIAKGRGRNRVESNLVGGTASTAAMPALTRHASAELSPMTNSEAASA
ncbi:MAG: GGDEF domain-containing protein [Candidatus Limnocylindrales bacterium]